MKIVVTGSREWSDYAFIESVLRGIVGTIPARDVTIIEGGCRGADLISRAIANKYSWNVKEYPARWDLHGKAAGIRRNIEMLNQKVDLVVGFHDNYAESRGTKHCIEYAKKRNLSYILYSHERIIDEKRQISLEFF